MCGTCGCGEHHHHHDHMHEHSHGHEHHHHPDEGIVINLEQDILQRNNLLAERNRGYFEAKNLFCLNLMSSPGSGKTTLLNILASLDRPTSGEVLLEGKNIVHLTEKEISAFRRKNLGFVFQDFNLLDTFSLRDNIYLPLVLTGEDYREMEQKIRRLRRLLRSQKFWINFHMKFPVVRNNCAAVARALITNPKLILADEPTGALDSKAASALLSVFGEINAEGQTILMVTHSAQAASHASRVLFIKDGEVFHQIYKGSKSRQEMYQMIADTLTILTTGGEQHA